MSRYNTHEPGVGEYFDNVTEDDEAEGDSCKWEISEINIFAQQLTFGSSFLIRAASDVLWTVVVVASISEVWKAGPGL